MRAFATELVVLLVPFLGGGYWIWRLCGRPGLQRGLTWLWCGCAGWALHTLALQALVYAGWPIRRTAPWALAVLGLGVVLAAVEGWRARGRWRRLAILDTMAATSAALIAGAVVATVLWRDLPDRFLARQQPDQLNYFCTAQALADEKFSIDYADLGARPWLYRTIETKHQRITQCVVLAAVAVGAGTDCQRAWLAVNVGLVALLAAALYGFARNLPGLPPGAAAAAAVAGALAPAVMLMFANGYFSQISTLWVFAALPAIGRPGAVARRTRLVGSLAALGFLAGAYTEFFPLAWLGVGAMSLVRRATLARRLAEAILLGAGALLLTTGYLWDLGAFFEGQLRLGARAEFLNAVAPDAATWAGWCAHFFRGPPVFVMGGGALLVLLLAGGFWRMTRHRRRWTAAALAAALTAVVCLLALPQLPTYAFHKLTAIFSPLLVVLAAVALGRGPRLWRVLATTIAAAVGLAVAGSGASLLWSSRVPGDALWDVRQRVEAAGPQTYLIARDDGTTAGWLAFFGRHSAVYSEVPMMSDRRAPSESVEFRRVPQGVALMTLDVASVGPLARREPSPRVTVTGARETRIGRSGPTHFLGATTGLRLSRVADSAAPRPVELELGVAPLTMAGPLEVTLIEPDGVRRTWRVTGPTLLKIALSLAPGETRLELLCAAPGGQSADALALLQSVSLNPLEAPR